MRPALGLALAPGLIGLAAGFYGVYRGYYGYTHFGPVAASSWSLSWLAGAGSLLLMGLAIFWLLKLESTPKLSLHTHGLAVYRSLRAPLTLGWEDMQGIATQVTRWGKNGAIRPQDYQITILHRRGRVSGLRGMQVSPKNTRSSSFPDFLSRLKAAYYPRLLLRLRPAWAQGEWLSFGVLQASRTGIRWRKRQIQVQAVRQITVEDGDLVVRCYHQPDLRLPLSRIFNYEVLLALFAPLHLEETVSNIHGMD
jgi:hypothetical protein